jgi:hypothetical protein
MKKSETIKKLTDFGLRLDASDRSQACVDAFCVEMESRQYGINETANAFAWFESGWKQAAGRLK